MSIWGDFIFYNDYLISRQGSRQNCILSLAVIWTFAFVLGGFLGWTYRSAFSRFFRLNSFIPCNVIVRLLVLSSAVLLLCFATRFRLRFAVPFVFLLEGCAFGAFLIGLICCYPSFGWLLGFVFLAPKTLALFFQLLYCQICLKPSGFTALGFLISAWAILLLVLLFEECYINYVILALLNHL